MNKPMSRPSTVPPQNKNDAIFDYLQNRKRQEHSYKKNETSQDFSVVLSDFQPVILSPHIAQEELLQAQAWLYARATCISENVRETNEIYKVYEEIQEKVKRYGVSPEIVRQRQVNTAPPGFPNLKIQDLGEESVPLYHNLLKDPQGIGLDERMKIFERKSLQVMQQIYAESNATTPPDDIIHITCSGYLAPSPAEKFVSMQNWYNTTVTHSYHMGCYGAFPALRMATGFLSMSHHGMGKLKSRVDLVHTEFLSLHSNLLEQDADQIVSASLFADGFMKYSLFPGPHLYNPDRAGLKILNIQETILPDSLEDMTWNLSPHNFVMHLSKSIPYRIADHILSFAERLIQCTGSSFKQEKDSIFFAIHPGGSKIIDLIQTSLQLKDHQVSLSRSILHEHGNMSSATLPFIWKEIVEDKTIPPGTKVLSLAFGPGLTAAGALMEKS